MTMKATQSLHACRRWQMRRYLAKGPCMALSVAARENHDVCCGAELYQFELQASAHICSSESEPAVSTTPATRHTLQPSASVHQKRYAGKLGATAHTPRVSSLLFSSE
jgi:hypothetical protein